MAGCLKNRLVAHDAAGIQRVENALGIGPMELQMDGPQDPRANRPAKKLRHFRLKNLKVPNSLCRLCPLEKKSPSWKERIYVWYLMIIDIRYFYDTCWTLVESAVECSKPSPPGVVCQLPAIQLPPLPRKLCSSQGKWMSLWSPNKTFKTSKVDFNSESMPCLLLICFSPASSLENFVQCTEITEHETLLRRGSRKPFQPHLPPSFWVVHPTF